MFNSRAFLVLLCSLLTLDVSADLIDGEELIDPTRPIDPRNVAVSNVGSVLDVLRNVAASNFDVTFVRASNKTSIAIINDQRVKIGDTIGGATVLGIDRGGVTLLVDDQETHVNLFGTNLKAPATDQ